MGSWLLLSGLTERFCQQCISSFISIWTPDNYWTEARVFPSAVNGSVAWRPPPRRCQGWLFQQPGPERHLHVRVPALSMTRPSFDSCLLTYELPTNSFAASTANRDYDLSSPDLYEL